MSQLPCLQAIEVDFKWRLKNYCKENDLSNLKYSDIKVTIFEQTWGSTALGFGGIGGQAMTSAYTTVIWDYTINIWAVYFGNRMAYIILDPNDLFMENVFKSRNVASVAEYGKYKKKINTN